MVTLLGSSSGSWFYSLAHGRDSRPVSSDRVRKSIGVERTYDRDILSLSTVEENLNYICSEAARRLKNSGKGARTITLKCT